MPLVYQNSILTSGNESALGTLCDLDLVWTTILFSWVREELNPRLTGRKRIARRRALEVA